MFSREHSDWKHPLRVLSLNHKLSEDLTIRCRVAGHTLAVVIALPDSKRGFGIHLRQNLPCAFQVKVLLAIREDAAALFVGAKGGEVNIAAVVNDVLDALVAHRNKVF